MLKKNQKIVLSAIVLGIGVISLYGNNPFGLNAAVGNGLVLLGFAGFAWVIFGE